MKFAFCQCANCRGGRPISYLDHRPKEPPLPIDVFRRVEQATQKMYLRVTLDKNLLESLGLDETPYIDF